MKPLIPIITLLVVSIAARGQEKTTAHWTNGYHSVKSDSPFPLAKYHAPDQPFLSDGQVLHCIQAGPSLRICQTISNTETAFVFELNGKPVWEWPASTHTYRQSGFEILRGDLDGDRIDEVIIANLDSIGNGMGIHRWKISIFQNPQSFGFHPPLELSVEAFGTRGAFIKHSGDRRCQILATEWHYLDHPRRGHGMYVIGRWYNYNKGTLIPAKGRPVVVRRYLFGFADQVERTQDDPAVPLRWFKHRQTEIVDIDPAIWGKKISDTKGVIKNVLLPEGAEGHERLKIEVREDSGQNRIYKYSPRPFEDTDEFFFRFASGKYTGIYPEDYNPAGLQKWLVGRKVHIASYEVSYLGSRLGTRQIIWLENR